MKSVLLAMMLSFNLLASYIAKYDNPFLIGQELELTFDKLALQSSISDQTLAWPGSHWPSYLGSISHRWSSSNPQNFSYKYNSREELQSMEMHLLDELSPAEKFDIYLGDYNYSTVRSIRSRYSPNENEWHGICHGVAVAALNHPEPKAIVVKTKDNIELEFYASDLKGLLSYFYARYSTTRSYQVGKRCYSRRRRSNCKGLNAGSFHILISNFIGLKDKPIIVDTDQMSEVWNHVAMSYESYIVNESDPTLASARRAVKRIRIQTLVKYASAIAPKFQAVLGTEKAEYMDQNYDYYIELDKDGKIVGGEWISELKPDFVWTKDKSELTGKWKRLREIYPSL